MTVHTEDASVSHIAKQHALLLVYMTSIHQSKYSITSSLKHAGYKVYPVLDIIERCDVHVIHTQELVICPAAFGSFYTVVFVTLP